MSNCSYQLTAREHDKGQADRLTGISLSSQNRGSLSHGRGLLLQTAVWFEIFAQNGRFGGLSFVKKMKKAMSVLEEIQVKSSQLPPELQAEVLEFIQSLDFKKSKTQKVSEELYPRLPNKFGAGKGLVTYIADDFDAPLDDLKEYMY